MRGVSTSFPRYLAVTRRAYLTVELAPPEMNAPASEAAVAALEKMIGYALPVGLRKAWLVADGQGSTPDAPLFWRVEADDDGRFVGYDFLSVETAREARTGLARRSARVESDPRDSRIGDGSFLPGWLPFADFGAGASRLLIDLQPSPMGAVGQIILLTDDPPGVTWVAGSFDELVATSLAALESDPDYVLREVAQDGEITGRRPRRDDRE